MKRGQFDFVWIFAMIAGASILVLAIMGAMRVGDTQRYQSDTEAAKGLSIIIDNLQGGYAESEYGSVKFNQETKINNFCFEDSSFGETKFSIATRSDVLEEWNLPGGQVNVGNKYVFSEDSVIGEDYYIFTNSFNFPYKVADVSMILSKKYCFIDPPRDIENDVILYPFMELDNCSENSVRVCFSSQENCDVMVYGTCTSGCESAYDEGKVLKYGTEMRYVKGLMYPAIFSDKGIYDCNVKRLMYRTGKLAELYSMKADLMNGRNCNTRLKSDMVMWQGATLNATVTEILNLNSYARNLESKNRELCKLW